MEGMWPTSPSMCTLKSRIPCMPATVCQTFTHVASSCGGKSEGVFLSEPRHEWRPAEQNHRNLRKRIVSKRCSKIVEDKSRKVSPRLKKNVFLEYNTWIASVYLEGYQRSPYLSAPMHDWITYTFRHVFRSGSRPPSVGSLLLLHPTHAPNGSVSPQQNRSGHRSGRTLQQ